MICQRQCRSYVHIERGFTLIEVLVAMLVTSIGVLGFIKMQALAIANTQISSTRSLVALQASSLAAAMHGNPGYWASGSAPTLFSAVGSVITENPDGVLNQVGTTCIATTAPSARSCTPTQLAAYDLQMWTATMTLLVPTYSANFTCTNAVSSPISCVITISWSEKYVALNKTTATGSAASGGKQTARQSYSLYVAP